MFLAVGYPPYPLDREQKRDTGQFAESQFAERQFAESQFAERQFAERQFAETQFAEREGQFANNYSANCL